MERPSNPADSFLVCGLGALGQHCVAALAERFGVRATAIDRQWPRDPEIAHVRDLLADFVEGDCRQNSVLHAARVERCRAVLIVTSDDRTNAETALAARALNPSARLLVRSSQANLNRLLGDRLGNFAALEPTQLAGDAFALAVLSTETIGLFGFGDQRLRAIERPIPAGDGLCGRKLLELNTPSRRLLAHWPPNATRTQASLYSWNPETTVRPGDRLVYLEIEDRLASGAPVPKPRRRRWRHWVHPRAAIATARTLLHQAAQAPARRVAFACGLTVLVLLLVGTVLLRVANPGTTVVLALYTTVVLLLGGFADSDLFPGLDPSEGGPVWWLQLFSLTLTLAGTAFVGVLYALLTEALLSAKFQLAPRRPPVPERDHIVLIGIRRIGSRVASLLLERQQPVVGIPLDPEFDAATLPKLPLVAGGATEVIARANVKTAKSVLVGTEDELLNLELGLAIQQLNPAIQLAIRTYGQRLSENVATLLPEATVLSAYGVVAEAFAGAAFGENIAGLFRLRDRTVLVTEYCVEAGDTLVGLLLAEVAYGYGVVPVLHCKPDGNDKLMPSDDVMLGVGDRLAVLATIEGLRRVERGERDTAAQCWQVRVEAALGPDSAFNGGNVLVRMTGCEMAVARAVMDELPQTLPTRLFAHQAQRLVRELSRERVKATVARAPDAPRVSARQRGDVEAE